MSSAFIFPGQGSQSIGMGKALYEAFPAARAVFEEVDDALNQKLSTLMFDGNEEELKLTENTQPALMAVSMAVMRALESEGNWKLEDHAKYVAGHSLGEYSALAAAGTFTLADTAKLLRIRGQAMQKAVPAGEGAMAAVLGLGIDALADITQAEQNAQVCVVANDNCEGQVVISGTAGAVDKAMTLAADKGAKRSVLLPVSAPFHCPLMQPAADRMKEALAETQAKAPVIPVVSNVTAEPETDPEKIKQLLVAQVTGRVRWRESMEWMAKNGVDTFVEAGAGQVLTGLAKRIAPAAKRYTLSTPENIEAYLKENNK